MRDARSTETARIEKVRYLPMRLTCPRCGAQYEIAAAAIPAAGREVECSACSHVWFQPGQPKAAEPYDPGARPALNRPLNESILAILRDETARELQARQSKASKPAPAAVQSADQNIANRAVEPAPEAKTEAPAPTAIAAASPVEVTPADPEPVDVASVEAPAAQTMADIDWPATTVTSAPAAPEPAPAAPTPAPAETAAEPANAAPKAAESAEAPPFEPEAAEAYPPAPEPEAEKRPEPVVAALPDAAELAATLTRPGPPPALPPAPTQTQPKRATTDHAPATVVAPLPVVAEAKRGSGYASGFGLAAMLALGVVAVYALAPRVAADEDGGLLAEWRQDIDRGRLWLHDRIIGE